MRKAELQVRNFIKNVVNDRNESQAKLASRAGKCQNQVSEYLSGKRDIKMFTFLNYLEALDCNMILESKKTKTTLVIHPDDIRQEIIDSFL